MIEQEIKRSGYDGLLPAGLVMTGGGSLMPGLRDSARGVTGRPVRLTRPMNLHRDFAAIAGLLTPPGMLIGGYRAWWLSRASVAVSVAASTFRVGYATCCLIDRRIQHQRFTDAF